MDLFDKCITSSRAWIRSVEFRWKREKVRIARHLAFFLQKSIFAGKNNLYFLLYF